MWNHRVRATQKTPRSIRLPPGRVNIQRTLFSTRKLKTHNPSTNKLWTQNKQKGRKDGRTDERTDGRKEGRKEGRKKGREKEKEKQLLFHCTISSVFRPGHISTPLRQLHAGSFCANDLFYWERQIWRRLFCFWFWFWLFLCRSVFFDFYICPLCVVLLDCVVDVVVRRHPLLCGRVVHTSALRGLREGVYISEGREQKGK